MLTEEHMAHSVGGQSNPLHTSHISVRVLTASFSKASCSLPFPSDGAGWRDVCASRGLWSSWGKDLIKRGLLLGYSSCAGSSESPACLSADSHESGVVTLQQGSSASRAGQSGERQWQEGPTVSWAFYIRHGGWGCEKLGAGAVIIQVSLLFKTHPKLK